MNRRGISRRSFIASSVVAAGLAGAGYWYWNSDDSQSSDQEPNESGIVPSKEPLALVDGKLLDTDFPDPFAGGQLLGFVPFQLEGEGSSAIGRKGGQGHNSRRIIDVASLLMPQSRVTPAGNFYIRTEYPDLLNAPDDWKIKISGHAKNPLDLSLAKLDPAIDTKGPVLLECSGNHRSLRYGLLSVANWDGVAIEKVLDFAGPTNKATSVLINGFDDDSTMPDMGPPYHEHSMPTCSWVFTREQLHQTGIFWRRGSTANRFPRIKVPPFAWSSLAGLAAPKSNGSMRSNWSTTLHSRRCRCLNSPIARGKTYIPTRRSPIFPDARSGRNLPVITNRRKSVRRSCPCAWSSGDSGTSCPIASSALRGAIQVARTN